MQSHHLNEEKKMENESLKSKGAEQVDKRLRWRLIDASHAKTGTTSPLLREIRREVKRAIG
jgi:hypothetical protein